MTKSIAVFNIEEIERPILKKLENMQLNVIEFTDSPSAEALAALPDDVEMISVCTQVGLDADMLSHMPNLKFISTRSTGFSHIDTDYLKNNGIGLANCRHYCDDSVAEHVLMLILNLLKEVPRAYQDQQYGDFTRYAAHIG